MQSNKHKNKTNQNDLFATIAIVAYYAIKQA
jgi:hypothetical protein